MGEGIRWLIRSSQLSSRHTMSDCPGPLLHAESPFMGLTTWTCMKKTAPLGLLWGWEAWVQKIYRHSLLWKGFLGVEVIDTRSASVHLNKSSGCVSEQYVGNNSCMNITRGFFFFTKIESYLPNFRLNVDYDVCFCPFPPVNQRRPCSKTGNRLVKLNILK